MGTPGIGHCRKTVYPINLAEILHHCIFLWINRFLSRKILFFLRKRKCNSFYKIYCCLSVIAVIVLLLLCFLMCIITGWKLLIINYYFINWWSIHFFTSIIRIKIFHGQTTLRQMNRPPTLQKVAQLCFYFLPLLFDIRHSFQQEHYP